MKRVVIFGASGHAHVVADVVRLNGDEVVAFLDDNVDAADCSGRIGDYINYPDCEFVVGIGNPIVREKISELPLKWHTAVHPSAIVSPTATLGEGTVVFANAVINTNAVVGKHCIINTAAVVEHDNQISDYAHVSVGVLLGGMVFVGKRSWIGIGSIVSNNISICSDCTVGAGAVVVKNIEMPGTYVGIPAKLV